MAKEIVIENGKAKLVDPVVKQNKDKDKKKKPKNMTSKEQIEYLFAFLGINIDEDLK